MSNISISTNIFYLKKYIEKTYLRLGETNSKPIRIQILRYELNRLVQGVESEIKLVKTVPNFGTENQTGLLVNGLEMAR